MSRAKAIVRASSLAALLLTTTALAAQAPPAVATPAAEAPASSAKPAEDVVCGHQRRPGSRIVVKACLTPAQRAARTPWFAQGAHDGSTGSWGAVSTAGASVGMSAFTSR